MTEQRSGPAARRGATPRLARLRLLDRGAFPVPAVKRIIVKNYKSIAACDVELGAISLLVGPNGSGKSNFIDALRLVSDALSSTLEYAIRERGGVAEVRRRSRGHPTHFGVRVEMALARDWNATYAFEIAARKGQSFEVQREDCRILDRNVLVAGFSVERGELKTSFDDEYYLPPEVAPDRLYLQVASALPYFRRVYRLLTTLGFYNLNPDRIRELQNPDIGDLLSRDGSNLAAVIRRMNDESPQTAERVSQYLNAVVPGVRGVTARSLGPKETIEVRQEVSGDPNPWRYLASGLSDGTLRALGVLVAVFQATNRTPSVPLVAVEEPEVAIHPGAAVRLMDALLEATQYSQLLITTHSPDLLDHPSIDVSSILAVESQQGTSVIAPVDKRTKKAVRSHLYTVGELLRLEQVSPDLFAVQQQTNQLRLFGTPGK